MQPRSTICADPLLPRLLSRAGEVLSRWETIRSLVSSNLRAGHRDKALGHLWNLLDPLMFVGVYFVVFGLLFNQAKGGTGTFVIYLSIGVLTFRFFDGTIMQAANCIRANRGLIHEISFPKAIFPIAVSLSRLYDLLWGLLVLMVIILIMPQVGLTLHVLWALPLIALLVLFTSGLAFIISYLGAFFADTSNVVSVVTRLLMYLSPTFYYVRGENSRIPEAYQTLYMSNPLACFFETLRDALLWGRLPEPGMVLYAAVVSLVVFAVGFCVFVSGEGRFAKYI